jgi:hypothetical protein
MFRQGDIQIEAYSNSRHLFYGVAPTTKVMHASLCDSLHWRIPSKVAGQLFLYSAALKKRIPLQSPASG